MRSLTKQIWAPILAAGLCLTAAQAQQAPPPVKPVSPTAPLPPADNPDKKQAGSTSKDSREEPASPALAPNPVVTGGLTRRAAEISDVGSNLRLGFQVGELLDTNYQNLPTPIGLNSLTYLSGHLDMVRMRQNSNLTVRYAGGGNFDAQSPQFNSHYHEFDVSETVQFRRWTLNLNDSFSYLPESAFGFEGGGPGGATLLGPTFIDPSVSQSQSIFTPHSRRISNTLLAQAQIMKSERTTWTLTGSYALLHYVSPGFLDPTNYAFGVGYNYQMSEKAVLGVSYQFNAFRFRPALASINDSVILVTYGQRITGRLAFHGGIGPEINTFTPVGGPSAGSRIAWAANAGISYSFDRTTLDGSFSRSISGGAGILLAAVTNSFQISAGRQMGQWWAIRGMFGYASNKTLPQASTILTSFNGLYIGAGFTRQIGERSSLFFNYNFIHQSTNAVCGGPACAGPFARHQFWMGFSFDFRPIGLK
jgi:hypothetical protein